MFTQTWKKYLPVILIMLKRSVNGDQSLSMNHTDFERAAGGKKIKYSFSNLKLDKGRINSMAKHSNIAKELAAVLVEEELSVKLVRASQFEFSMGTDFKLMIRNHTVAEAAVPATEE